MRFEQWINRRRGFDISIPIVVVDERERRRYDTFIDLGIDQHVQAEYNQVAGM
jgi:hypothetical protein